MQITIDNSKQIINSYMPLIISMARKFPSFDEDEAIDETKMIVIELIQEYDVNKGTFGNFIKNKLRYYYLDKAKKAPLKSLDDFDSAGEPIVDSILDDNDLEEDILRKEKYKDLYVAVSKLPKRDREILKMKYRKDLTNKEISQKLGISSKTVSNRLSINLARLRELLEYM